MIYQSFLRMFFLSCLLLFFFFLAFFFFFSVSTVVYSTREILVYMFCIKDQTRQSINNSAAKKLVAALDYKRRACGKRLYNLIP